MKRSIVAGLVAAALAGNAQAVPLEWTLQNWAFEDGGTAFGSYVFDADTFTFSSIDVKTTAGAIFPGATYASVSLGGPNSFFFDGFSGLAGFRLLGILASAMTNSGGTIAITGGGEQCITITCGADEGVVRDLVSGSVTTTVIPLPAGLLLMLTGLACLLGLKRPWRMARMP